MYNVKRETFSHYRDLREQDVFVMQDQESANTLPGGGEMRALHETTTEHVPRFASPAHKQGRGPQAPGRILLVEDDSSLASLEADILTAYGYMVTVASSGEQAIAALQQATPDLIVLDLQLPGSVTGWDVLQNLRIHARTPVLLTSSDTAARAHLLTSGEARSTLDHLPKPYPMHVLLKRIERMLLIAPG